MAPGRKRRRSSLINGRPKREKPASTPTLPDVVWMTVLSKLDLAQDCLRLGAVSQRLHDLSRQRIVWRHLERVAVVLESTTGKSADQVRLLRTSNKKGEIHRDLAGVFSLADDERRISGFKWLFNECQPKRLTIACREKFPNGRYLDQLIDAVQLRENNISSFKNLSLDFNFPRKCAIRFERLLQLLAVPLTHFTLKVKLPEDQFVQFSPKLAASLQYLPNVQFLRCHVEDGANGDERLGQPIVDSLVGLPKLKGFHLSLRGRQPSVEILNRHPFGTITHLCCLGNAHQLRQYCTGLLKPARLNITTICCLPTGLQGRTELDFGVIPGLFPNCREMVLYGEVAAYLLNGLTAAYNCRKLGYDGNPHENRLRVRQIFDYFDLNTEDTNVKQQDVVRSVELWGMVEITRVEDRIYKAYTHCAIAGQF